MHQLRWREWLVLLGAKRQHQETVTNQLAVTNRLCAIGFDPSRGWPRVPVQCWADVDRTLGRKG